MNIIDLSTSIIEITSAYDTISSTRIPFFFVIGAGVSYPSIPLATEIIKHCKEKTKARGFIEIENEPSKLLAYSHYFDRAYPQPIDRQRYLRSLIENKPITDANLRLAHLLLARKITNLVITPNFDDLLSRSLTLFGIPHIVADHPHTVDRIDLEGADIQIIHVHGSYRFYDCRNLQEELEHRARPSLTSTKTMAAFLDRALSFRSPLVVGYSGWEGDVIMDALRRRLEGSNLPYRLYWYCYDEGAIAMLPSWLRDHNDVRFVVSVRGDSLDISNVLLRQQTLGEADSVTNEDGTKTLPAKIVFEELSRAFELDEPALTRDPVAFFAKQLRASVYPAGGKHDAVYFFGDVISRVERAAELEKLEQEKVGRIQGPTGNDVEGKLEKIKDLVRRSRYDEAIQVAVSLPLMDLGNQQCVELYDIFAVFLRGEEYKATEALRASDLLVQLGERLIRWDMSESVEKFMVEPLMEKAHVLYGEGRQREAIDIYNLILEKLDTQDLPLQYKKAYIKSRKAIALGRLNEYGNALALYDELIPELENLTIPSANWLLSQSRFNRAIDLANLMKSEEAILAFDEYVRLYRDAPDGWTQVLVAAAIREKAHILSESGRINEAINTCDELITLYGTSQHPQVSRTVIETLLLKAQLLFSRDRPQEALKLYEEILKRVEEGRVTLSSDRIEFLKAEKDRLEQQSTDKRPISTRNTNRRKRELKRRVIS